MSTAKRLLPLLTLALCFAWAAPAEARGQFFGGGGVGVGFGDVRYAELSGLFGYIIDDRWSTAVRVTWRNREDTRFDRDVSTNDYGASVLARFRVTGPFYLQGEVEHLNYEFILPDLSTDREGFTSLLFGAGINQKLSENVRLFVGLLYNLSYDSSDFRNPYSSPWILRAGVGFIF